VQSITGLSPSQFIRSIRLKRAAQLLRDTQYNISEIADLVGFGTIKYFNIHFKEEFGLTPTLYRQKIRSEQ
jgi:AraC-like DNA-binding protein